MSSTIYNHKIRIKEPKHYRNHRFLLATSGDLLERQIMPCFYKSWDEHRPTQKKRARLKTRSQLVGLCLAMVIPNKL